MNEGPKATIIETRLNERLWQLNESQVYDGVSTPYVDAYLILGDREALLVDSLMTCPDLYKRVRQITSLPLSVAVTHGHGDHAGASLRAFHEAGCPIYMDLLDLPILSAFGSPNAESDWFRPLRDGDVFELGGISLEAIAVPGHSPGSFVLLDSADEWLFTGDAIGSGAFWMQIPTALSLDRLLPGVERLLTRIGRMDGLLVYPGHRAQSPVQLTGQYVRDCETITRGILDGKMVGEPEELTLGTRHLTYRSIKYGMYQSYCYDPNNLREAQQGDLA